MPALMVSQQHGQLLVKSTQQVFAMPLSLATSFCKSAVVTAHANEPFRAVQVAAVYMYMYVLYVAFPMLKTMQQHLIQPFTCQHTVQFMLLYGPQLELSCLLGSYKCRAVISFPPLPFPIQPFPFTFSINSAH